MRIKKSIGTIVATAAISAHAGTAGPTVDTRYGTGGTTHIGFDIGGDKNDLPQAATLLQDGTFIIGGQLQIQSGSGVGDGNYHQLGIARFNPDGTPDATFGTSGKVELAIAPPNGNAAVADVGVTDDGHILVLANYSNVLNTADGNFVIERLNSNGALDTSFNLVGYRIFTPASFIAGGVFGEALKTIPLHNGKLLVSGVLETATVGYTVVARLNSDGSYDNSFANGTGYALYTSDAVTPPVFFAPAVALASNGKILLGGYGNHGSDPNNIDMTVLRLADDGSVDTTFGTNGWTHVGFDLGQLLTDLAQSMFIDSSGRIVLAGVVDGPTTKLWGVARLLANGQIDTTFGSQGRVTISVDDSDGGANSVITLADGRIIVGGSAGIGVASVVDGDFPVAVMLQSDGTVDSSFGNGGKFIDGDESTPYASAIVNPIGVFVNGDDFYFPGNGFKADGADVDFGISKVTRSIFRGGFDSP